MSDLTEYYRVLKELQDLKIIVTSFLPEHYIDSARKEIEDASDLLESQRNEIVMLEGAQHVMSEIMGELQTKWISVKDKLPEDNQMVIGYTPVDGYMFVGYLTHSKWGDILEEKWHIITAMRSDRRITKRVTHWMPLPELPKEK